MARSKSSHSNGEPETRGSDSEKHDSVSRNLRKVYQTTVAEDIPEEMLDLLKKLG